jgi:hypothetical protein
MKERVSDEAGKTRDLLNSLEVANANRREVAKDNEITLLRLQLSRGGKD